MWITGSQILLVGLLHRTLPLDSSLQFTPQHSIQSHTKSRKVTLIPFDLRVYNGTIFFSNSHTVVICWLFHVWYLFKTLPLHQSSTRQFFFPTAKYPPPIPSPSDYKRIRSTSKCFSANLIKTMLLPI